MVKKFGVNEKQAAGRSKKQAHKDELAKKRQEEAQKREDQYWSEGVKDTSKKREEEDKRALKVQQKQERDDLLRSEEAALLSKNNNSGYSKAPARLDSPHGSMDEFYASMDLDACSDSDSQNPIKAAETEGENDRHPEKRMRAAYKRFEERELPLLKKEYPYLKFSQLQQLLFKKWKKSPENPLNTTIGA